MCWYHVPFSIEHSWEKRCFDKKKKFKKIHSVTYFLSKLKYGIYMMILNLSKKNDHVIDLVFLGPRAYAKVKFVGFFPHFFSFLSSAKTL